MKDLTLLPKLIEASTAMDEEKRQWLLANVQQFDDQKREALFDIFTKEQEQKHELNTKRLAEKQAYENKRGTIIRAYNERKSTESDEVELLNLEQELQAA